METLAIFGFARVRPVNHIFTKIRGRARLLGASSSRHSAAERQCPASLRTEANARQVKPKAGRAHNHPVLV